MSIISIKICKVPLCENEQYTNEKWMFCLECMVNTVRRFMISEGSFQETLNPTKEQMERAQHWIDFINKNWKTLVEEEKKNIKRRGVDYDRDKV